VTRSALRARPSALGYGARRAARGLGALLAAAACARAPAVAPPPTRPPAPTPAAVAPFAAGLAIAERHRVAEIATRRFTHDALWRLLAPALASPELRTQEIGRSVQGRALRAVTFGRGPTTVLLWSQMHGNESTATMALADVLRWMADSTPDPLRDRLARELTVVMVPMLNPDGAEVFERENAWGIDINRDARRLATPEARALKALRDRVRPQFGFNLHDQQARTRAGARGSQVAVALLAPPRDAQGSYDAVRARARLVAATLAAPLTAELPGRVAKYDESFNPRAFGDLMQQWGTSTVLVESGALPGDPEKQRLRALNVAALVDALDAIATRRYEQASPDAYERLPGNVGGATDVLIVGGRLVLPGQRPLRADVAVNYDDPVARRGGRVRDVGDLGDAVAIDTVDARGLFVHADPAAVTASARGATLRVGAPAALVLRRGPEPTSAVVRRLDAAAR
jgi:predicted deacylase